MHLLPASLTRLQVSTGTTFDSVHSAREAFLASDSDFLIFRRFDTLNASLLLYLQDQIVVLEGRLEKLEDEHMADDAADMHHGSFRHDGLLERTQLFETLNGKFESTVSCLFVV
jgi:hypothetical protein